MTVRAPVQPSSPGPVFPAPSPLRAEVGVVLAAASVFLGARAGEHMVWAAATLPSLALATVPPSVLWLLAVSRRRRWLRKLAVLVALAAIGAASMARALSGLAGPAARLAAGERDAEVTVRLAADPHGRWTGVRVPGRLEVVDGTRARGLVLVVARPPAAARLRLLEAGESAVLTGRFRPLEDGERSWRWRHAGAVFEAGDLLGAGPTTGFLRWANGVRHRVLAGGEALGPTDRALVAGFLVGDDRDLPPAVAADFRAAGLSHLLVVSGANVTLALALVAPLLLRFSLFGRLVGGAAALLLFCAMTRFEPSVLRAGAMSGLALLASFVGRPVSGLRLLALAGGGLVLLDPFLVHSLGFGLSCGASAGILLLAGPLARRLPGPRLVREPLAVTAAAQVGSGADRPSGLRESAAGGPAGESRRCAGGRRPQPVGSGLRPGGRADGPSGGLVRPRAVGVAAGADRGAGQLDTGSGSCGRPLPGDDRAAARRPDRRGGGMVDRPASIRRRPEPGPAPWAPARAWDSVSRPSQWSTATRPGPASSRAAAVTA